MAVVSSQPGTAASMREFVAALEREGELARVERKVDWDLEMGAIARRCYELGAPAPLFTDVRDTREGLRAIGAPMGIGRRPGRELARIALALGLPATAGAREIIDTLVAARDRPPLAPHIVETAPSKQNVLRGEEVDLTSLPVPLLHAGDGGRYLNTLGMVVTRTPDGRWTSWTVARIMLLDQHRASYAIMPFQHTGKVFREWRERGEDMPVAVALGVPPGALYAAGMPLLEEVDEAGFAGALIGASVPLARCEAIDLEVPAESEIVLEGRVSLEEHGLEAPFGDYSGYMSPTGPVQAPVYTVEAMSFRDEAIYPFTCSGEPADETHTVWGLSTAAEAAHMLRGRGLPVTTAWCPFDAANGWLVITLAEGWREVEADAGELCRMIGDAVLATKLQLTINTIVVAEDDVDPADLGELVWAIDGRRNGTVTFARKLGFPFSPYTRPDFANYPDGWMSTAEVWNLLPPEGVTRPPRTRFEDNYPDWIKKRVRQHWQSDGLGDGEPPVRE